ncbi:MAG: histidine phosphatase family protein [Pseudomonadota bacterium]
MELILWRHAEAFDAEPGALDMERALTPKGHKQARRVGDWLAPLLPDDCRILVSPARRTIETAEALGRDYEIAEALAPGSDEEDVLDAAGWPNASAPVLVVGHQPTLGQVAAVLMSGQPQDWHIKKGNLWWLVQRDAQDPYSLYLKAVISPELIGK